MRRFLLVAALLIAGLFPATAQICPTAPFGTSNNQCASTAFVASAVATANMTVGTSQIFSGTSGRVLYDNAGILGELATTGTGSVVLNGSPSITTPNLTSPALSGTVTGNNTIPLGILAQSAANTMLGNWTGSAANVTANAMVSCADTGGNHLNYVSGTGITCGTSTGTSTIIVGTTPISGGTDTRIFYDNSGVVGEYTLTGTGTVVAMQTSPSLITPALGIATATSVAINGCTIGTDELCVTGTTALQGTTFSAAITYGGVTLANAVTGTGNMVLATSPSVSGLTVTGSFTATGLVANSDLANAATTVNGQTCTLGSTCTVTAAATSITVGSTTVTSGTAGRILGVAAGPVLSEFTTTGSGTEVALSTSPSLTTPALGIATGTSLALSGCTIGTDELCVTGTAVVSGTVTLGSAGGTSGTLVLTGSTSGTATLRVAAVAGTATIFQLPATNGTNTQILQTDGTGVTSWVDSAGGGTVTSVAAGTGMSFSTITATGSVAIDGATAANLAAGTSNKVVTSDIAVSGAAFTALTAGATVTPDLDTAYNFTLTPNQNFTLANPSNITGKLGRSFCIVVTNDSTPRTITWGTSYYGPGGSSTIALTASAGAIDQICGLIVTTTQINVTITKAYSH